MAAHGMNRLRGAAIPAIDHSSQRETAARVEKACPGWLVMWGPYYREYWAYPCFNVPQGTILHSGDPGELVREMRSVQMSAMKSAW
jgi:hypothetical protein